MHLLQQLQLKEFIRFSTRPYTLSHINKYLTAQEVMAAMVAMVESDLEHSSTYTIKSLKP